MEGNRAMKYLILLEEYAELAITPVSSKQMAKIRMYLIPDTQINFPI